MFKMKFLLSIIVFSTCFVLQNKAHKCIHDTLNVTLHKVPNDKSQNFPYGYQKVTQQEYKNIRIHADFTSIGGGTYQLQEYLKNQLMPSAISFFQSTLKVIPLSKPLKVKVSCGGLYPSRDVMLYGIETDLLILVTAQIFEESFVAAAMPCGLDDATNRPVYGVIYFNLKYLSTASTTALEENLSTTLHEMTHILGFASNLYYFYINPLTGKSYDPVGYKEVNGKWITYLNVEPLTSILRSYFNCPTLEGAYLEDAGSEGSAGSHFERRVFMNEFMTASTITDSVISEFTLALLEGTGWYKVDYSIAEPFHWGKNKGCSFLDGPCVDNKGSPNFEEFCSPLTKIDCTHSSRAIAICGTIGPIQADPLVSPSQDYWGNQTTLLDPFGDNCPYYVGFSSTDCENAQNQKNAFIKQERYGSTSRCFGGTLSSRTSYGRHLGFCFPTECQSLGNGKYSLRIQIENTAISCTQKKSITVPGLYGYLECPDPNSFCEKANPIYCERGCSGRSKCINGRCNCPEGWTGSDCGLRTYVVNCERCQKNQVNNTCFGDNCYCDPNSNTCSGPTLVGVGGESDKGQPEPIMPPTPIEGRKIGIFIWIIVCVIVLLWKGKLVNNR